MTATGDSAAHAEACCPVCGGVGVAPFGCIDGKRYFRCGACEATFLRAADFPPRDEEHARYRQHRNDPGDPAYRAFLSRLADPLLERLPPHQSGLDYGCGPGPALARMLEEAGHRVALYDPLFAPDGEALNRTYDFVTCTETAEHFHRPAEEFARLTGLVRPGGWLGIMTCFQTDDGQFAQWHYRRDPTHVVFYREATFRRLAQTFGWRCESPRKDVVLLQRPADV